MKNLIVSINSRLIKSLYYVIFQYGYYVFLKTGKTPERSYQAMVRLYCMTSGFFNEKLHEKIKLPKQKAASDLSGVLGNYTKNDFESVNDELKTSGYFRFDQMISQDLLSKIYQFSLAIPTYVGH